jgi:hypothetical protein
MNPTINPTLIEDIQCVIQKYAKDDIWKIHCAEDNTNSFKNLFSKFEGVAFNEMRSLYHYIKLPHDLYVTLEDQWTDIDIDLEAIVDISKQPHQEQNPLLKQTINLYICDRSPQFQRGCLELGMRIVHIKWNVLFRSTSFGISEIKLSVHNTSLEDPQRLPLLLKIIEEVSKVPCLKDHI